MQTETDGIPMASNRDRTGIRRSPYPDLLGSYDWGQAGMKPTTRWDNPELWACLGSVALIVIAVAASAIL
jgi:hypothetical protein